MKISKVAASQGRRLYGLCQKDGRLDESKMRVVIDGLVASKPRDYRGILAALQRLVRLEEDRRRVTVESAIPLDEGMRTRIAGELAGTYGSGLSIQYQENSELIGGLRIRVGDDLLDGSIKGRLERLAAAF